MQHLKTVCIDEAGVVDYSGLKFPPIVKISSDILCQSFSHKLNICCSLMSDKSGGHSVIVSNLVGIYFLLVCIIALKGRWCYITAIFAFAKWRENLALSCIFGYI